MIKTRILLVSCFLLAPSSMRCQDSISLDKLSDCQGLAKISESLNGPISSDCRTARKGLENSVMSQFPLPNVHTCIRISSPVAVLAGFTCLEIASDLQRELTCLRTVDKSLLNNYIAKYDSDYRVRVNNYLKAARQCSVGNGDATAAPNTLFPPFLNSIARARFGFALQVGNERKSQIYHAYADLDPTFDASGEGAIEVLDFLRVKGKVAPTTPESPSDSSSQGMTLKIEDALDGRRSLESVLRRQSGLPAVVKLRFIDFNYSGSENIPIATRQSDLDDWQEEMSYLFDLADYREPEPEELAKTPFHDIDGLRDLIAKNQPFGQRNSSRTLSSHIILRVDDRYPQCAAIAEVMVLYPEQGVKNDYGSMAIILIGLGDCRIALKPDGTLSDHLLTKVTDDVRAMAVK